MPVNHREKGSGPSNVVWNFFASVKLSFVLFLSLALTSILGTLLPQREPLEAYTRGYGEAGARMIQALGLDDMYHSYWFLLLMVMLAVNLVVCSLNRLPAALKIMNKDPDQEAARVRKAEISFTAPGAPADNQGPMGEILAKALGKVHRAESDGGLNLFAQRGAWSRLGVYIVHASVLIIFAGAMVGNIFGYEGRMSLAEGQSADHIVIKRGQALPLGFAVRLDKFTMTHYEGSGMVSEFRSDLTFFQAGKEVRKWALKVNHPVSFEGIDFYQASYDQRLDKAVFRMQRKDGQPVEVTLPLKQWAKLPGGGEAGILEFRPDVKMGAMYHGAFARVLFRASEKEEPIAVPAFQGNPPMAAKGDIRFTLLKWQLTNFTGLSVKYDPGVWFVWVGCILMILGILVTFYTSHRKVWVRLTPTGQARTRVEIAGGANRNRLGLKRSMEKLAEEIKQSTGKAE